jgi:SAM-dependent methyltransferase
MKAPTERFSDRVENYVKYRPSYPAPVLDCLRVNCGLSAASIVADIGSGTGLFTELLLQSDCRVFAVEPNDEMRHAAEKRLRSNSRFHSVSGAAEQTGLESGSIDIVTAAQAFHWFRFDETQREFRRIIKTAGWIALVWNQRKIESPFQMAYDEILRENVPDYGKVNHRDPDLAGVAAFLGPGDYQCFTFENRQYLDLKGLAGRVQSASYTPNPGMPNHAELMADLKTAFQKYAVKGRVALEYETQLHLGRL